MGYCGTRTLQDNYSSLLQRFAWCSRGLWRYFEANLWTCQKVASVFLLLSMSFVLSLLFFRWLQEIQMQCGNVNLVLIGNKCDDPDAREVPTKEAKRFATNMKLPFYETSARDNINVEEAFTTMTKLALLAKKSQLLQRDSSWQSPVTKIGKDSGNSRLLSRLKRKHPCCKWTHFLI